QDYVEGSVCDGRQGLSSSSRIPYIQGVGGWTVIPKGLYPHVQHSSRCDDNSSVDTPSHVQGREVVNGHLRLSRTRLHEQRSIFQLESFLQRGYLVGVGFPLERIWSTHSLSSFSSSGSRASKVFT